MMFIENKYLTIYKSLVYKRRKNPLCKKDVYCESHHIIPRSLGGGDNKDNIVNLLPREHYIAHRLLTYITSGRDRRKMMWALHRLVHGAVNPLSSKQYDRFRREWAQYLSENHHSKTNPEYAKNISGMVTRSWVDAADRRREASLRMSEYHAKKKEENSAEYYKQQRENSIKGAAAMKESVALRLEYKGEIYLGWSDLLERTGCSKHLYKKFYKNGIDPDFRIGKDGVMDDEDVTFLIEEFCKKTDELLPITRDEHISILTRMINCGILSETVSARYLSKFQHYKQKGGVGK